MVHQDLPLLEAQVTRMLDEVERAGDADRGKVHAYRPHHDELARCIGNDAPHLCLARGAEVMVDSLAPARVCSVWGAEALVDTCERDGPPCPAGKAGRFAREPEFLCIS